MMVPRDGDDFGCFFFLWVFHSKLGEKSIWHDIIRWIYQVWWWGSAKLRWSYYEDSSRFFILFIGMELPKEGRWWAQVPKLSISSRPFWWRFSDQGSRPKTFAQTFRLLRNCLRVFFFPATYWGKRHMGEMTYSIYSDFVIFWRCKATRIQ